MNEAENERGNPGFLLLLAAGLAQFIVCADYFAIAIALPPMAADLGVSALDLQWVITGYILSFCATLGVAGALGDRYGRKKLLLLGIIIFAVVSVWVGIGRSATEVVIARILLGLGGGLIFPLGTAVVTHASSDRGLARNIAMLTGIATIGTAFGPVLGGVLTETLGWRWIFFANIPICAIAFVMVLLFSRESRDPDATGRLDFLGILLLVTGIGAVSIGIDRIPHWSLSAWGSLAGGGLGLLLLFCFVEARIRQPIIDVRLFGNREFLSFSATGMLANSAWCVLLLLGTLQLQKILGDTVLQAAWVFLFLSGSVAIASFVAPALERRLGAVMLVRIALLLQTVGIGLLFFFDTAVWLAVGMFIAGFGCSWGWAMPQAGAIRTIPRNKAGVASGSVLTLMIMAGNTAFVAAAMVIALYPDDVTGEARGIRTAFLGNTMLVMIGFLVALFFLKRMKRGAPGALPATGGTA